MKLYYMSPKVLQTVMYYRVPALLRVNNPKQANIKNQEIWLCGLYAVFVG